MKLIKPKHYKEEIENKGRIYNEEKKNRSTRGYLHSASYNQRPQDYSAHLLHCKHYQCLPATGAPRS